MDEQKNDTGSPSGEPVRVCTRCKKNPRPSNSSWCRECRNEQAAEYRARTRPKVQYEDRVCALDGCDVVFQWSTKHVKQVCCCKGHYEKYSWRRDHPHPAPPGEIFCTKCERSFPTSAFSPSRQHLKRSQCRECMAEYEREWLKKNTARRSATTRRSRTARRLREMGAPADSIDECLALQGGACGVCKGDGGGKAWHMDHDHAKPYAQSFRGILCHWCNIGMGSFFDDVEKLRAAIAYLECFQ